MSEHSLVPVFKNSWQLLSAQSSKVVIWFIAINFFNFAMVALNLRIPKVMDNAVWGQLFWCLMLGVVLGGMELLRKRQEFLTALPISRTKIFLNRLVFGVLAIFVLTLLNYCLNSGLAEQEIYGEVWMDVKELEFTLLNTSTLLSTFLCGFAMATVARTFSGIILSFCGSALFFLPVMITELNLSASEFRYSLYVAAGLLTVCSFFSFRKVDRVVQGISGITTLGLVSTVYWLLLIGFGILTISNL